MRFKKLLFEDNTFDSLIKDCAHFLDKTKNNLSSNFYLGRASPKNYNTPKFRPERERKQIRGSKGAFYFYNKFRPSDIPPRHKQVPCLGGSVSDRFSGGENNSYAVFPAGTDYKMIYTEGVPDFNFPKFRSIPESPHHVLTTEYYTELRGEIDPEVDKDIDHVLSRIDSLKRGSKPKKIMKAFDYLLDYMEGNEELKLVVSEAYDALENHREYWREFFSRTHTTQELTLKMDGLEVGLYAPDGFYYVSTGEVHDLLNKMK